MFGGHNDATQPPQDAGMNGGITPADATTTDPTLNGAASAPAPEATGVLPAPADLSLPVIDPSPSSTAGAPAVTLPTSTDTTTGDDDLLSIKQQALQQLSPLVGQLDQTPEDKFRTTMMMIQASDNQGLIKDAFSAAQQIADEKVKAQALLDIVNEINYFTQAAQAPAEGTEAA